MADPKAAPKLVEPPKATELAAAEQADPPVAPDPAPTGWRMTYPYAALYLTPGRISRYVQPGEVIDWGDVGPPDGHWEPVTDAQKEA